jgi:uncharacterized spore protein YtfJ
MEIQAMLRDLGERLGTSASVKSVYGDPLTAGDRTVVPVAKVCYSFGAGGGRGREEREGQGGGGGGMVAAWPSGALEVTPAGTRFIGVHDGRALGVAMAAGFVLGAAVALACRAKSRCCKRHAQNPPAVP